MWQLVRKTLQCTSIPPNALFSSRGSFGHSGPSRQVAETQNQKTLLSLSLSTLLLMKGRHKLLIICAEQGAGRLLEYLLKHFTVTVP